MRITTPPAVPDPAIDLEGIDLSTTMLYTAGDAHSVWHTLRARQPVFWRPHPMAGGFWSVTRHADVRRVLRDHRDFTSERGTALDMIGFPDPAAGKMMHATDPPRHREFREPIEQPLRAQAMSDYTPIVRTLVRGILQPQRDAEWDAAAALSRLPVAVVARLMGLPDSDVDFLQHAAYASVAPHDPHYRTGSPDETLRWAHTAVADYFTRQVSNRRAAPSADLLSHLITMEVAGRQLTNDELISNCFSLLVGGVVTTAQVASATLNALAEHGGGEGRWPAAPDGITTLLEEALRWSSPTTHFVRYARNDVDLHGVRIRHGEPVAAWIASANRDEDVFDRPYIFDPGRRPNRHITFGTGVHRCVGRQLARTMLQETFEAMRATMHRFEVGEAVHLASNLIAGIVHLPVRVRPTPT